MTDRLKIVSTKQGAVLLLREGQRVDPQFERILNRELRAYEPDWVNRWFSYDQAVRKLPMQPSRRWLERLVSADAVPHLRIAGHVIFTGHHLEQIITAMEHGALGYNPDLGRRNKDGW